MPLLENALKVTRLASALVATAFGLASFAALADVPVPQDVPYQGTLKISVDDTDLKGHQAEVRRAVSSLM